MLKPDIPTLEAMIADAEAKTYEARSRGVSDGDDRRGSREKASAILTAALGLSDADRAELGRLAREHDDAVRRSTDEKKHEAIERSGAALLRLDEIAVADRTVLGDDPKDPYAPVWPSVAFIRSTPGASILDQHVEESNSWAKWYCNAPSLSSGREKLSFFFLWQNPKKTWTLADISLRLTILGHFECSAEGWGLPAGWWSESRSDADVSAELAVWPVWLPHDASQPPEQSVRLERLIATAGVFSDTEHASLDASVVLRTARYAVPREAFILIEASVALDHQGAAEVDCASGDFLVKCPVAFVTLSPT